MYLCEVDGGIRDQFVTGGRTFARAFFFSSRRRHTRSLCDWSSDVCSSDPSRRRHTRSLCDWSSDVCSSDRTSTRLNYSQTVISYVVFCWKSEVQRSGSQTHYTHSFWLRL